MDNIIFNPKSKPTARPVRGKDKKNLPVKRKKGTTMARAIVSKPPDQGNPLNQASTPDGRMRMMARANKDQKVHTLEEMNDFEIVWGSKEGF